MKNLPDAMLENHGSITLLRPFTLKARHWCAEHLPDDAQHWGEATVIEARYVKDIALGMLAEGLVLA